MLDNGLGRYDAARDAAREVFERDHLGFGHLVVAELAEAAARTGDAALVQAALDWLSERTRVTPTEWVLGIEARIRALLSDGEAADGSTGSRSSGWAGPGSAPSWPVRTCCTGSGCAGRAAAAEAREQLRTAHQMLDAMGMAAFAERARRELRATGETARKRTVPAARTAGASER